MEGYKLTALLRKREGWRPKGGRAAEPPEDRVQFGGEQRRSQAPFPSPIPQPKSQREPVPARELACTAQTPNTVLLRIHPSGGSDSRPVPQGPSRSGSPKEKRAEPAPPAPVHPADPPQLICQIPSTTSLAVCK